METPHNDVPPKSQEGVAAAEGAVQIEATAAEEAQSVTAEYVTFRSLRNTVRLRKPQEMPETWQAIQDPETRLATFMQESAPVFQDSADAWREIRENQREWSSLKKPKADTKNRRVRRDESQKYGALGKGPSVFFGMNKQNAQDSYTHIVEEYFRPETPYEQRMAFFRKYQADVAAEAEEEIAKAPDIDDSERIVRRKIVTDATPYLKAFAARDEALRRVSALLDDEAMRAPFAAYVQSMAADDSRALTGYPGFIEILATHVLHKPDNNLMRKAVRATAPAPETYSTEYLTLVSEGKRSTGRSKELAVIGHMLRLTGTIVSEDFSADPSHIITRMAEDVSTWPQDLQADLQAYATAQSHALWQDMASALEPYGRSGRLPSAKGGVTLNMERDKPLSVSERRGKKDDNVSLRFGERRQDHEDIVEPEIIDTYAIVGANIKGRLYDVDFVDTLEELYEFSNLADYARHHSADPSLEPLFKAALKHLCEKPYDRSCVEKLKSVEYEVDGDPSESPRKPWRFKPQTFPQVSRGPIARDTRIIYDVVKLNGKRTLIIYGAFIKQDIEHMNTLPRRS